MKNSEYNNIYVNRNSAAYRDFLIGRDSKKTNDTRIDRLESLIKELQDRVQRLEKNDRVEEPHE